MNKSYKSEKDKVNVKLQKTISNLISSVISSLCQQVVQYENSIDIFGLLCINIDDDVDISVKLNEKFIKKEVIGAGLNVNYSKLIESLQKNDLTKSLETVNKDVELEKTIANREMDTDNKENEVPSLVNESEKSSKHKRRPRKPQLTFRHFVEDDIANSSKAIANKSKCNSPMTDSELKIDTQFECQSNGKARKADNNSTIQSESISKSNETDESEEKLQLKSNESTGKNSQTSSTVNIVESYERKKLPPNNAIFPSAKLSQMYKCTICDRQFKRKFCLTRHKRVHQNYKTYLCNVCGMGFDLINQLKRHLRNAHACSRENLRRSCRNTTKSEEITKTASEQQYCPMDCTWTLPKASSQLSLLPPGKQITASTVSLDIPTTKTVCFNQFPFPPGLIIANSGKKPSPSAFSQTFTTPTSVSTQYQVRQMLNSIMSATEASIPYNNALYYMQNYAHILPTTSNALYHSLANGNTPKTMPNLSSAPSTTITNSCSSQRLPIYRFPPGLFTSPSLKSVPLPLNSSIWNSNSSNSNNVARTPDSNQPDKIKQSASPIANPSNQLAKITE